MYHVVSKGRHYGPKQNQYLLLKGSVDSRDDARAYARANDGSVKTDAELTQLIGDGKIEVPSTQQPQEPSVSNQNQFPGAAAPADDQSTNPNPKPEAPSISGAAEQVANEQAQRTTVGKKAKPEPKRVKTSDEVLAAAREHIATLAPKVADQSMSKVDFVRDLALWNNRALQRGDAIKLTEEANLGISPATVSTQFQFARSDRMTEYADRASKRADEAKEREAKKNEKKAEQEKKAKEREAEKAKREQEKKDKEAAREKEKAEKEQEREAEKQRKADEKAAKEKADAEAKAAKDDQQPAA